MVKMTSEEVSALLWQHWQIKGQVTPLPSYADHNYRIRSETADYVLKIANPAWALADLDFESQAMLHLAKRQPSLQVPRVFLTGEGEHIIAVQVCGETVYARLLSYVPGSVYADSLQSLSSQQREALLVSLGREVGRLTTGLSDFQHPAAQRAQHWNLLSLPSLLSELPNIADTTLRTQVARHANYFCQAIPAWRDQLPMQVLHNDANDLNVLVTIEDEAARVSAVIDFGDMCHSFRLADLAITCTYAIQFEPEPLRCAGRILRGYRETCALSETEEQLLFRFILARLCHSVLMATRAHRLQPDNPFILVSQKGVRALLNQLGDLPPDAATETILENAHD